MPTLTKQQDAADAKDAILRALLRGGPQTRQSLGESTRHRLLALIDDKLVKRAGTAKNAGTGARHAVLYDLTANGRKRAANL